MVIAREKIPPKVNHFSSISIIYNPHSTGSSTSMAKALQQDLAASLPKQQIRLVATKYAGHAEKLAYQLAQASSRPLIISASGDGGYHEVINGLIRAQQAGAQPTAGLVPAGNANDHFHDVHNGDLVKSVSAGKVQQIDLIKLTTTVQAKPYARYAHSYIGFGLTPKVGHQLNRVQLNAFNEVWIVLKVLFLLKPIKLVVNGRPQHYDSLIFSNVSKMSKVLSLSEEASNKDGKFEVTIFRRRNKLKLISYLIKSSTAGLAGTSHYEAYAFKTLRPTLVQLDGEVSTVDARADVKVTIEPKILQCIV